jgi:hypothetical protein
LNKPDSWKFVKIIEYFYWTDYWQCFVLLINRWSSLLKMSNFSPHNYQNDILYVSIKAQIWFAQTIPDFDSIKHVWTTQKVKFDPKRNATPPYTITISDREWLNVHNTRTSTSAATNLNRPNLTSANRKEVGTRKRGQAPQQKLTCINSHSTWLR